MRGLRNNFDPYLQIFNRLEQYVLLGHNFEKIELIIMGGTFPAETKKYQEEFEKRETEVRARYAAMLEEGGKENEKELGRREAGLIEEYKRKQSALEETADSLRAESAKREAELETRLRSGEERIAGVLEAEKQKLAGELKAKEAALKKAEAETEAAGRAMEQEVEELKSKIMQEGQEREKETAAKFAESENLMRSALEAHRDELNRNHEQAVADLRLKEAAVKEESRLKINAWLKNAEQQQEERLARLTISMEQKRQDMESSLAQREKMLNDSFASKLAQLEGHFLHKEKSLIMEHDKRLFKRQEDLEAVMRQKEITMENRLRETEKTLQAQWAQREAVWESQKRDIFEQEKQTLRAEFEKKEKILCQKSDEEAVRYKELKTKLEDEYQRSKNDDLQEDQRNNEHGATSCY